MVTDEQIRSMVDHVGHGGGIDGPEVYEALGQLQHLRSLYQYGQDAPTLTDGPVRTVTRREVVPGVYDRVSVRMDAPGFADVAFVPWGGSEPLEDARVSMTPDQLKAAAAVLLELAGALDE